MKSKALLGGQTFDHFTTLQTRITQVLSILSAGSISCKAFKATVQVSEKAIKVSGSTVETPRRPTRGPWEPRGHTFHDHNNLIYTQREHTKCRAR